MRTGSAHVRVRRPMRWGSVLAATAGGAALSAGSATLTWASATGVDELRGPLAVSATGNQVAPALVPVAAAALAALGAVLAAKGGLRRAVGAITAGLGAVVGWLGIHGLLSEPAGVLLATAPSAQLVDVRIHPLGPSVAALGAVLLVMAGVAVLTGRSRPRELGPRYERAGGSVTGDRAAADPDQLMWKELDAHRDPTLGPPAPTGRDRLDRASGDRRPPGEPSPEGRLAWVGRSDRRRRS